MVENLLIAVHLNFDIIFSRWDIATKVYKFLY